MLIDTNYNKALSYTVTPQNGEKGRGGHSSRRGKEGTAIEEEESNTEEEEKRTNNIK